MSNHLKQDKTVDLKLVPRQSTTARREQAQLLYWRLNQISNLEKPWEFSKTFLKGEQK